MATLMEKDVLLAARANSFAKIVHHELRIEKSRTLTNKEIKEIESDYSKLSDYSIYLYSTKEEELEYNELLEVILNIGSKYDNK